ncbi:MAG: CpaF family protein [Lachnospiraceae bacterium]|nr:CpaF family protein [Lachnospiraceae bacterium]
MLPGVNDEAVLERIDEAIRNLSRMRRLSLPDKLFLRQEVFNAIRRLDVLQSLIDDEEVTEIMVNGLHNIFIEKGGKLYDSGRAFASKERLQDIIQQIVAGANRTVNTASPIVDARLPDGARVSVVLEPVALNGPILTIRRFPKQPVSAEKLLALGSVSREILDFLKMLVAAKYNLIISGGTGSGKTTFLNIMSGYIPKTERIITIEDSAELQLMGIENLVRLETRNANVEGCKPITIRDLIKASLRMRPDRVIVGEVRGEEAVDMVQAMNIGMDGSLSTIHANSAADALSRLEAMMLMSSDMPVSSIRRQISSGIDIIVQLGRLRDKSRHLLEIREVIGLSQESIETKCLYVFEEKAEDTPDGKIRGSYRKMNPLFHREKLEKAGIRHEL